MTESLALTLQDPEPVVLELADPEEISLVLEEQTVVLEVNGDIGPPGPQGAQGVQGDVGPQGATGPVGPQGSPGLDSGHYRHVQPTPSTLWTVQHNLGYRPAVSVQDSAGTVVYGDIEHIDTNTLTVAFTSAFSGYADVS